MPKPNKNLDAAKRLPKSGFKTQIWVVWLEDEATSPRLQVPNGPLVPDRLCRSLVHYGNIETIVSKPLLTTSGFSIG